MSKTELYKICVRSANAHRNNANDYLRRAAEEKANGNSERLKRYKEWARNSRNEVKRLITLAKGERKKWNVSTTN